MNILNVYLWYRTCMNAYEPNNAIRVMCELIDNEYRPLQIDGRLHFKDGTSIIGIYPRTDGKFDWINNDKSGVSDCFNNAWNRMPQLITDPDYYTDSPIYPAIRDLL